MSKEKQNLLHVSLAEMGAYQCEPKRMPGGKPFSPEEYLDPNRRSAGRALRRVHAGTAKKMVDEIIKKIQQKR